jgi:hypothetical protein
VRRAAKDVGSPLLAAALWTLPRARWSLCTATLLCMLIGPAGEVAGAPIVRRAAALTGTRASRAAARVVVEPGWGKMAP